VKRCRDQGRLDLEELLGPEAARDLFVWLDTRAPEEAAGLARQVLSLIALDPDLRGNPLQARIIDLAREVDPDAFDGTRFTQRGRITGSRRWLSATERLVEANRRGAS